MASSRSPPCSSWTVVLQSIVILGLASTRSCMILLARSSSRRCSTKTWLPYLARKLASSMAVSPPPTTASGLLRNMGRAPSHTAQALTPFCQNFSLPVGLSFFARAPVAMITLWAAISWPSEVQRRNGRCLRSTRVTSSWSMRAPNRAAWPRIRSISSPPPTPSGKPGKFSTSVVVMSCPPGISPRSLATEPSMRRGWSSARAA